MAKYQLTNKAVEDLANIWNYTFEVWSEVQADKYFNYLLDCFQNLADNPKLGRAYSEVTEFLLGYRATQHIIFFRKISQTTIEIVRVLHSKMDLKNRISE
jgi:toxin ParE1/3/4